LIGKPWIFASHAEDAPRKASKISRSEQVKEREPDHIGEDKEQRPQEDPDMAGYANINRALPADERTPFVEKPAHRIASFPAHAIAHAKAAVDSGAFSSMAEGLLVEARESDLSVASEVTQARVTEALKAGADGCDVPVHTAESILRAR